MLRVFVEGRVSPYPTPPDPGDPGYETTGGWFADEPPWTIADPGWFNAIQEELLAIIEIVGGLTPSHTDVGQAAQVLQHVRGIRSGSSSADLALDPLDDQLLGATDTCEIDHAEQCAILASAGCLIDAAAAQAFIAASATCTANAINAVILASGGGTVDGSYTAMLAATAGCAIHGEGSLIAACDGQSENATLEADALYSAILACGNASTNYPNTITGACNAFMAACSGALIDGGTGTIYGSVALAVTDGHGPGIVSGNGSILLGGDNCELYSDHTLAGGYSSGSAITRQGADQNLTWRLNWQSGVAGFKGVFVTAIKTGTSQANAGAVAGELWADSGTHAVYVGV